ncbi:hypothetical protein K438DRAFT_1978641 [Mycena galopus ATCC 62051]|nr:hypothetical protein K438DRAFT_1978641 [Mycena galopus ATCC 62051]
MSQPAYGNRARHIWLASVGRLVTSLFTILSRTYHGHTRFEAAIMRPTQVDESMASEAQVAPKAIEVPAKDGRTRWDVQRNFCADDEAYREYVIIWDVDGTSIASAEGGAGQGVDFISCLEPGDKIAVIARARYLGWVNYVQSVQVSVYYSLV